MRKATAKQQDLFEEVSNDDRIPVEQQAEVVTQLALLILSVIDATEMEARDEQDPC